jgi:2-polyprenyl-6-hydroxyphenyl methylase/3-demethylubiquinone-9 3-methyltransferase
LEWFRQQALHGLLGEVDEEATGDGVIVCKDGFRAETGGPDEFTRLAGNAGVRYEITEVDGSSLFCVVSVS